MLRSVEDQRSIANRLAAEEVHYTSHTRYRKHIANVLSQKKEETQDDPETAMLKKDPTLPVSLFQAHYHRSMLTKPQAKMHGNEPSRGAKIDAEIAREEEEELKRKGKA